MPDPSIDELSKSDWDAATTQEQDDIIEQVEYLSSTGWAQLSRERKSEAIRSAIAERDTLYTDRMSRLPTLDGDAEVFAQDGTRRRRRGAKRKRRGRERVVHYGERGGLSDAHPVR